MFFLYFSIPSEAWPFASEPQKAKPFEVKLLLGYTISIIATHAPGQQLWTSLAPCSTQKALKQLKFDVEVKTWNPVSARLWDCHWLNLRRRKIWRVQEYKSTSVSPLTVSVLCKMAAETHLRGETESFHTLWYLQISPQIDWIFPREELDPFLGAQESRWRIFGISFLMTAF